VFSRYRERGKVIRAETQAVLGQSIQKLNRTFKGAKVKGMEKVRMKPFPPLEIFFSFKIKRASFP
jgi:hypothetical protein